MFLVVDVQWNLVSQSFGLQNAKHLPFAFLCNRTCNVKKHPCLPTGYHPRLARTRISYP